MTDQTDGDDAPPATAKHGTGEEAVAAASIAPMGDSIAATAVTIRRPAAELYAFWRDFSNLAQVMDNVARIDMLDGRRSHWVVRSPGGGTVEWEALVTEETEGRLIAWESQPGADVANAGRIEFRDAGERGTVVTATIVYDPPAGVLGKLVAKMFQREPAIQARRDLRRFKQLMETGEIATAAMNLAQVEKEAA